MRLCKLELRSFRNYQHTVLEFPRSLNVFVGENAQGKTNLLEAVYLLAVGRSHRTSRESDMIAWGSEFARVRADVERELGTIRLDTLLRREGSKEMTVGGEKIRRQSDLLGHVNVVVFAPDDLQLVKGAPALRRRFLDLEIAQISPTYRHHFARYQKVLRQRNNLLKAIHGGQAHPDALDVWDPQVVHDGARIVAKRAQALRRLSEWSRRMQEKISGGREELNLIYQPFFDGTARAPEDWWEAPDAVEEAFWKEMRSVRRDEIYRSVTLVGPQRDDIGFWLGDIDLRYFGSQGQQRTAVLSCKLAEIEFMKDESGDYPILLLDDVMSELDDRRRSQFLHTVTGRINTFITTTNLRSFTDEILREASTFTIRAGSVLAAEGV